MLIGGFKIKTFMKVFLEILILSLKRVNLSWFDLIEFMCRLYWSIEICIDHDRIVHNLLYIVDVYIECCWIIDMD